MRRAPATLLLGVAGLLLAAGCVQAAPRLVRPALPPGFGALMPDAPVFGYLYMNQERDPFVLQHTFLAPDGNPLPVHAEVETVSVWLGPGDLGSPPAVAARIVFWREEDAQTAQVDLARAVPDLWMKQDGALLSFVLGDDEVAAAFRGALDGDRFVPLGLPRHRAWNTILALPVHPEKPVIGAGYVDVTLGLLPVSFEALAAQGGPDLRQVQALVERARIGHVAFAIYGDRLPMLTPRTSLSDLAPSHLGAIAVADTAIPEPLLSLTFKLVGRRLGLDQVRLRDGRAYFYGNQELVTLTRTHRESIYIALAFSENDARLLLEGLDQ